MAHQERSLRHWNKNKNRGSYNGQRKVDETIGFSATLTFILEKIMFPKKHLMILRTCQFWKNWTLSLQRKGSVPLNRALNQLYWKPSMVPCASAEDKAKFSIICATPRLLPCIKILAIAGTTTATGVSFSLKHWWKILCPSGLITDYQWEFRIKRSTVDLIFSVGQLQEGCWQQ